MKKKLGLVYGGKSAEHEVSLSTATAVTNAIDFNKYEVIPVYDSYKAVKNRNLSLKNLEKEQEFQNNLNDLKFTAGNYMSCQ